MRISDWSSDVYSSDLRMNKQVEKILQSARIEKQDIKLNLQNLNAHEIISKVAANVNLQILDKDGKLYLHLEAENFTIRSEEHREGKEFVRTCRSRWSPYH